MTSNITFDRILHCNSSHRPTSQLFIPVSYLLLFPVAVVLNCVAAWISLHLRSTSTFMVYQKNLVFSDLLITLTIPMKAIDKLPNAPWMLHMLQCRLFSPIFYCCTYTSIALLGLISLDRFLKIVQPCGKLLGQNLVFGKLISALVWTLLIGGTVIPTIILTNKHDNISAHSRCIELKGMDGVYLHQAVTIFLNVLFCLICVLVVVCYVCIAKKVIQSFRNSGSNNNQAKQKTKLRVFLVLVVFFVSFVPYHLVRIPHTFQQMNSFKACPSIWTKIAKEVSLLFATLNICLDPLLYFFLCRAFREKLKSMM